MIEVRKAPWLSALALAVLALTSSPALASYQVGFSDITNNSAKDAATAGQYSVTVFGSSDNAKAFGFDSIGANQAVFVFKNTSVKTSSITDIYFQDGTLLAIGTIKTSKGVDFGGPANPSDLPGGKSLNPDFHTTEQWSMDSNAPHVLDNGINRSDEWLAVQFSLKNGQTYNDVVQAIITGYNNPASAWNPDGTDKAGGATGLRFGIHVQGFADGKSESFVSTLGPPTSVVPEPSAVILALTGIAGCGFASLRRLRRVS